MHVIPDWFVLLLWLIHTPYHAAGTLLALVALVWGVRWLWKPRPWSRGQRGAEPASQPACPDQDCGKDRERKMVTVADGVWCDPCIAPLVSALNGAGIATVASCCGHNYRPGFIALKDGRWLVVARDDFEHRRIEALFPVDINGEARAPSASGELPELRVIEAQRCDFCHPETCSCADYKLTCGAEVITTGDYDFCSRVAAIVRAYGEQCRRLATTGQAPEDAAASTPAAHA